MGPLVRHKKSGRVGYGMLLLSVLSRKDGHIHCFCQDEKGE